MNQSDMLSKSTLANEQDSLFDACSLDSAYPYLTIDSKHRETMMAKLANEIGYFEQRFRQLQVNERPCSGYVLKTLERLIRTRKQLLERLQGESQVN